MMEDGQKFTKSSNPSKGASYILPVRKTRLSKIKLKPYLSLLINELILTA
jgi:hypothetical protein